MHQKNMVHRDLKPENILLDSIDIDNIQVKIADFGFSCLFDPKQGMVSKIGTLAYMAPEILKDKIYGPQIDVWSIGTITFMLLTGKCIFKV
jgi:serine/threonine protein kinase